MAAQKKRGKGSYLNDFEKSQDGGYVYAGKTWHADAAARRRILVKLWALQVCMLLAAFLPGFVTTAGLLNTFYVIIPYVFWLISDFALAYTLGNVTFGGNPLRDYIYERSVKQYRIRTMFPLAGAALTRRRNVRWHWRKRKRNQSRYINLRRKRRGRSGMFCLLWRTGSDVFFGRTV